MPEIVERSAILSEDGVYRYRLTRTWDRSLGVACFVMLNPSTANAEDDDPTIRRCLRFAHAWGYGALTVVNLYALRSTDPKALRLHHAPCGPDNDAHILAAAAESSVMVAAWGAFKTDDSRAQEVLGLLGDVQCLGVTLGGAPRHPLYVKGDVLPQSYQAANHLA